MSPVHSAGYGALVLALLLTSAVLLLIAIRGDDIDRSPIASVGPPIIVLLALVAAVSGIAAAWLTPDSLVGQNPNTFLTVAGAVLALITMAWGMPVACYIGRSRNPVEMPALLRARHTDPTTEVPVRADDGTS